MANKNPLLQAGFFFQVAQLNTFLSTLTQRSIMGLKTAIELKKAAFTRLCIFRPRI
jgi:hypothetical protein